AKVCGNGRCPYCGSCLVLDEGDGRLRCRRCGYVLEGAAFYEYIAGRPSTYSREEQMPIRPGISGRLRQIAALRRGITWKGLGSNSKASSQKGARDMANYVERLAKALMETGDFSEDEVKAFVEELVKELMGRGVEGEGEGDAGETKASLPKVETVVRVWNSITSGKPNAEGGRYDMAIAEAIRWALAATRTWRPLIKRALRLLRAEPSDDLVGLGVRYFEELYEHLREEVGGVEPWRYVTSIAIAAAALAKVEKLGAPLNFVKFELRVSGFEKVYEALRLEKIINKVKVNKAQN
ncbi:MAG: TFIIB-type zinc ribbon-containing protein, partial [Vulcanisaeta sp.]|nr:TFIIB-type zinc ribbon-containing protein [Vulcanisaeta sp.]